MNFLLTNYYFFFFFQFIECIKETVSAHIETTEQTALQVMSKELLFFIFLYKMKN